MVRPPCPRFCVCSPNVVPPSREASARGPRPMRSTPACSALSPSGWPSCCRRSHLPRVLELGCGTGLFSRHLLAHYPDGTFVLSDLAPSMVEQCRRNLASGGRGHVRFEVMDAARPTVDGPFDLIATSMTLHWLADPVRRAEHAPPAPRSGWCADLCNDQRQKLP